MIYKILLLLIIPIKLFSLSIDYEIIGHPLLFFSSEKELYVKVELINNPEPEKSQVEIRILSGKLKGKITQAFITLTNNQKIGFKLSKGNYALAKYNFESGDAYIVDYYRISRLPYLFGFLIIICIVFSGKRALLTLTGLLLKILLIIFYIKIFINTGYPVEITFFFISITLLLIILFNTENIVKKVNSSLTGLFSVIILFIITYFLLKLFEINGFYDEHIQIMDYYIRSKENYNITRFYLNIILASIMLSITGIIADISVSITSSLYEIRMSKSDIGIKELIKSGFKVGKDILSTEINTILLALYGSNFGLFIISYYIKEPTTNFLNSQMVSVIILNIFLGMLGIIITLFAGIFINGFFKK